MSRRSRKRKRSRNSGIIVALAILVLIVLLGSSMNLRLAWVSPGWEIYNQVGAMRHRSVNYVDPTDFTFPRDLMGNYWKVDIDEEMYGVPTMMCELGDIHHTDFTGKDISWDTPSQTRTVVRGNTTFYLDYHIYTYTVTIRTVADKEAHPQPLLPPAWWHETIYPHEYADPLGGYGTNTGETFDGGFYTKFVILPWRGITYHDPPESDDPNSHYELDEVWAGVMNTYVIEKTQGQIANQWGKTPEPGVAAPLRVAGGLDVGRQVPMFEDDGSFGTPAPTVDWDPYLTPDVRIESTVVHYLPIEIDVGAKLHFNIIGQLDNLWVCDGFITYKLRVDVLQSHEFTLQVGEPPPEEDPTDFYTWAESFWTGVLGGLDPFKAFGPFAPLMAWLTLFGVAGIIILILLAVFAPGALMLLSKGAGKGVRALKEVTGKKRAFNEPPNYPSNFKPKKRTKKKKKT